MDELLSSTGDSGEGQRRNVGRLVAAGIKGWGILYAIVAAVASAGFALGVSSGDGEFLTVSATAFLLANTAGLIGGFFGLLFGMPRESEDRAEGAASRARYSFNSNLLKVSDWMTTIIVGLSLVSLGSIPGAVSNFSNWISPALGDDRSSGAFGVFIAGASFATVFLLMYIWTTVPLRSHLENDAFDTEQQWASMVGQITENKDPDEISESLKTLGPDVLQRIEADTARTPPLLKELAAKELTRRADDSS